MRHFTTAALFHLAGWLLLGVRPEALPHFQGGLGPPLAALHALVLGTLVMVATGASLQIVPFATAQSIPSPRAARAAWWLLAPGTALLVGGMASIAPAPLAVGTAGLVAGLALHATLLAPMLSRIRPGDELRRHGRAAGVALAPTVAAGAWLVGADLGAAPRPAALPGLHAALGLWGLMTLLAVGFSWRLIPMFAVTKAPPQWLRTVVLGLVAAALGLQATALATAEAGWPLAAAVTGLAAAVTYVTAIGRAVASRGRPLVEGAWLPLARQAWGWLVAAMVAALAWALAWALAEASGTCVAGSPLATPCLHGPVAAGVSALAARGPALVIALLAVGWLGGFVLALLSRIVPFLAAVHAQAALGKPVKWASLVPGRLLAVHRYCHAAAVVLLGGGIVAGHGTPILAASAVGAAGAIVYAAALGTVLVRARRLRAGHS